MHHNPMRPEDSYVIISSELSKDNRKALEYLNRCADLQESGTQVILYLVQNAVLPSPDMDTSHLIMNLRTKGVRVICDPQSLKSRGMTQDQLAQGIETQNLDDFIDAMADHPRIIWH